MDRKLACLFLLLFCATVFAGNASMLVPAVVTDGGGQMIRIQVEAREGTGLIYTTTAPLVGMDTQGSERSAVAVGMELAGENASNYDVLLTMDVGDTRQVDGPSAGAAMALLTLSSLQGRHVRTDFTITGTIDEQGNVGPVGGVASKAEAAAQSGITVIAVPAGGEVFDKLMLAALRKRLNITVVEVSRIEQAAEIAFAPEGTVPEPPPVQRPPLLTNLTNYEYACSECGLDAFRGIAEGVVSDAESAVANVSAGDWENYTDALPILEKGVADSREMVDNGYYYTAANNAFLTLIDARVLQNSDIDRRELALSISEAQRCVDSLQRPGMSRENLELIGGGDLRSVWARRKLAAVREAELNISDSEELLAVYRETLYAQGWCEVAGSLYSAAEVVGGDGIDENLLMGFAQLKVAEAGAAYGANPSLGSDAADHLNGAEAALNSSLYVAAILDSDYVLAFAQAENFSGMSDDELAATAENLSSRKGETLWAALFYAHAKFYGEAQGKSGIGSVLRLGSMGERMGADMERVSYLLEHPEEAPTPIPQQTSPEDVGGLNAALMLLVALLSFLLIVSAVLNIIVFTIMKSALQAAKAGKKPAPRVRKRR